MASAKPTVVITGAAGNLGLRLLPLLTDFDVIAIDFQPPQSNVPVRFVKMDLGQEESCRELFVLLREARPVAVVHLAFVVDPARTGIYELERMWQVNVAGTARVIEAVTEANRDDSIVERFVFPSSVSVYGPDATGPSSEDAPLAAHTLPYAVHKMEADRVMQQRAPALRNCSAYMLRPHIFAGASVENYFLGVFRGTPNGKGRRAAKMREQGKRLPCMLPYGQEYLEKRIQFVHVDDMARLIAYLLAKTEPEAQRLTILNVAGRGEPLTFARAIEMAQAKLVRVPGRWALRQIIALFGKLGISKVPPEATPYLIGEYIMNTDRLRKFLGPDYESVIRFTSADAFADCFRSVTPVVAGHAAAK